MDPKRFDAIARTLGTERSRRGVLRALGATVLGGMGLAGLARGTTAAPGGDSACDAFCHTVFGDTRAAGKCTSDAAHGKGLCYQCGANPANYCNGSCNHASDPANCGGCGNVCTGTNGTATCSGGHCGITCNAGYADCNQDLSDGCETEIDGSDNNNCGGCGIICTGTCTNGQCECPNPGPGSTYSNYCDPNPLLSCTNGVTTLTADCLPNGGPPTIETSIIVNSCASANYVISNCDGTLTCGNCPP